MKVYCLVDTYNLKTQFGEYKLHYGFNDIPDRQVEVGSVPLKVIAPPLYEAPVPTPSGITVNTTGRVINLSNVSDLDRYKIMGLALNGCEVRFFRGLSTPATSYPLKIDNIKLTGNSLIGLNVAPTGNAQDIISLVIDSNPTGVGIIRLAVGSNIVSDSNVVSVIFY